MRRTAAWIAAGALLLGGGHVLLERSYRVIEPGGPTLPTVLAKFPDINGGRVVESGDAKKYLVLYGPLPSDWSNPSGPPVYVFDTAGVLVDWTSDIGDDKAFCGRWPGAFGGRAVSRDEVRRWGTVR